MKKIILLLAILFVSDNMFASIKNEKIIASRNGFLYQDSPQATLADKSTLNNMDIKNHSGYSRYGYVEFSTNKISEQSSKIYFRIYLLGEDLGYNENFNGKNIELNLFGGEYNWNGKWTWSTQPVIANAENPGEKSLGSLTLKNDDKGTFLEWDVTEFVKSKKATGAKNICFRISASHKSSAVLIKLRQLYIKDSVIQSSKYNPHLLQK